MVFNIDLAKAALSYLDRNSSRYDPDVWFHPNINFVPPVTDNPEEAYVDLVLAVAALEQVSNAESKSPALVMEAPGGAWIPNRISLQGEPESMPNLQHDPERPLPGSEAAWLMLRAGMWAAWADIFEPVAAGHPSPCCQGETILQAVDGGLVCPGCEFSPGGQVPAVGVPLVKSGPFSLHDEDGQPVVQVRGGALPETEFRRAFAAFELGRHAWVVSS